MKRSLILLVLCLITFNVLAQSPQKINYQAIVRNEQGQPVANQDVKFRLSILQGLTGSSLYAETQLAKTNAFGIVNLHIGTGSPILGAFNTIKWQTLDKYLQIEADITGGSSFTTLGNVELVSVPYALNSADNQWSIEGNDIINKNTGSVGIGTGMDPIAKDAVLDIRSGNKGVLIPKIASAASIATPTDGLLVYQTDLPKGFYFSKSGAWKKLADADDVAANSGGGTSAGAIIPFSSGPTPMKITAIKYATAGIVGMVGFGNHATTTIVTPSGDDQFVSAEDGLKMAFIVPRDGIISGMNVSYTTAAIANITGNAFVSAKLYAYDPDTKTFKYLSFISTDVTPVLSGVVPKGEFKLSWAKYNTPIKVNTLLLLVISLASSNKNELSITVNAGINIQ